MKKLLLLSLPVLSLSACIQEPPPPEHIYHTRTVYVAPRPHYHKAASAPAAPSESAESFRAVERPGTYSQ